jgi:hypothetical protein
MIEVRLDDGTTPVYLPRVDHLTNAKEAAEALWAGVNKVANIHGGSAALLTPADLGNRYAVKWQQGPKQWAQAYVVSDGAEAREFVATADDDYTVGFAELDA